MIEKMDITNIAIDISTAAREIRERKNAS